MVISDHMALDHSGDMKPPSLLMSSDDALESAIGQPHASCEVREALEEHRGLAWLCVPKTSSELMT
jgi:hypothetical protein